MIAGGILVEPFVCLVVFDGVCTLANEVRSLEHTSSVVLTPADNVLRSVAETQKKKKGKGKGKGKKPDPKAIAPAEKKKDWLDWGIRRLLPPAAFHSVLITVCYAFGFCILQAPPQATTARSVANFTAPHGLAHEESVRKISHPNLALTPHSSQAPKKHNEQYRVQDLMTHLNDLVFSPELKTMYTSLSNLYSTPAAEDFKSQMYEILAMPESDEQVDQMVALIDSRASQALDRQVVDVLEEPATAYFLAEVSAEFYRYAPAEMVAEVTEAFAVAA